MPVVSKPVIIGIALLIAILLLCTFYLCYRVRKARKVNIIYYEYICRKFRINKIIKKTNIFSYYEN